MSAPMTGIETQRQRHRVVPGGIAAVVIRAGALLAAFLLRTAVRGTTPQSPEIRIDGRTGEVTE